MSHTLCDPIDGSPPGSSIPGILQARTLEWVATSFSNAWKWKVKVKPLSCVRLVVTPWTAPTRLLCPWDSPGKSTGVGCHCLRWSHSPVVPQAGAWWQLLRWFATERKTVSQSGSGQCGSYSNSNKLELIFQNSVPTSVAWIPTGGALR